MAASRSRFFFLYSHAKKFFFQTSAKPSPPPVLVAPFSNVNHSPVGSAETGSGCSNSLHRSRKCVWAAARSVSATGFHFLTNSAGVIWGNTRIRDDLPQANVL